MWYCLGSGHELLSAPTVLGSICDSVYSIRDNVCLPSTCTRFGHGVFSAHIIIFFTEYFLMQRLTLVNKQIIRLLCEYTCFCCSSGGCNVFLSPLRRQKKTFMKLHYIYMIYMYLHRYSKEYEANILCQFWLKQLVTEVADCLTCASEILTSSRQSYQLSATCTLT